VCVKYLASSVVFESAILEVMGVKRIGSKDFIVVELSFPRSWYPICVTVLAGSSCVRLRMQTMLIDSRNG
jgi:hypothetical protein